MNFSALRSILVMLLLLLASSSILRKILLMITKLFTKSSRKKSRSVKRRRLLKVILMPKKKKRNLSQSKKLKVMKRPRRTHLTPKSISGLWLIEHQRICLNFSFQLKVLMCNQTVKLLNTIVLLSMKLSLNVWMNSVSVCSRLKRVNKSTCMNKYFLLNE